MSKDRFIPMIIGWAVALLTLFSVETGNQFGLTFTSIVSGMFIFISFIAISLILFLLSFAVKFDAEAKDKISERLSYRKNALIYTIGIVNAIFFTGVLVYAEWYVYASFYVISFLMAHLAIGILNNKIKN